MKKFTVRKTEKNIAWVNENLDPADFTMLAEYIMIGYYNDMQREDIENELSSL